MIHRSSREYVGACITHVRVRVSTVFGQRAPGISEHVDVLILVSQTEGD